MAEYMVELIRGTSHTLMGVGKFVRGKQVKIDEDIKAKLEKVVEVVTLKDSKGKRSKKHLARFRFTKLDAKGKPVSTVKTDTDEDLEDANDEDTDEDEVTDTTSGDGDDSDEDSEDSDESDDDDIAEVEGDDEDEEVEDKKPAKKSATKAAKKTARKTRDR